MVIVLRSLSKVSLFMQIIRLHSPIFIVSNPTPMLIRFLFLFLMLTCFHLSAQNYWENPLIFGLNKLPARATTYAFPKAEDALKLEREASPWFESLNGQWKFVYSPNPKNAPTDMLDADFQPMGWEDISVPGCWEMQGFGSPIYVNVQYPFSPVTPPFIPHDKTEKLHESNPVGTYYREFEVSHSWEGMNVILHFAGVSSAFYVWVNGQQVGYSQDSRLPSGV